MSWTRLAIPDSDFDVRVWQAGQGRPLVYLHGYEGHPGEAPFLQRLAARHRVLAPEQPGYGDSHGAEQIEGVLDAVLFYRRLFETAGIEEADLVGHSLGGMFAAEIAAILPYHVRRLVLVAPFGLWLDDTPIPDLFAMTPGERRRTTWHDPARDPDGGAGTAQRSGPPAIAEIVAESSRLAVAGQFLWPLPDRGLSRRLGLIRAPTLVIAGASDRLVPPAYGPAFASRIPRARSLVIEDAGHFPMVEQEDTFLSTVEAFLAG